MATFKLSFNSMKVRLKLVLPYITGSRRSRFNSMKVRLKLALKVNGTTLIQFQFHEGPIKTCLTTLKLVSFIRFQFHEGPIKTLLGSHFFRPCLCFNSMKVRLKRSGGA